jgi:hypothetical protein
MNEFMTFTNQNPEIKFAAHKSLAVLFDKRSPPSGAGVMYLQKTQFTNRQLKGFCVVLGLHTKSFVPRLITKQSGTNSVKFQLGAEPLSQPASHNETHHKLQEDENAPGVRSRACEASIRAFVRRCRSSFRIRPCL